MRRETILHEARFDEKLPIYWMVQAQLLLVFTVILLPLAPIWLIFGWGFHRKQLARMECQLTDRSLNIRKGVLFRVEKNIPLDKIQDVGLREGPILRWLGLSSLVVETAGQSGQAGADAHLIGIVDAPSFRDRVLDRRDEVVERLRGPAPVAAGADEGAGEPAEATALLREISDSLVRIEGRLDREA